MRRSKMMNKKLHYHFFLIIIILLILLSYITAGTLEFDINFSKNDLVFSKINEYDFIDINDGVSTTEPGEPDLPTVSFSFVIPPDSEVVNAKIVVEENEILPGIYNIYPKQPPIPFSMLEPPPFIPPDENIYNSSDPFPRNILITISAGSKAGYRIGSVLIFPIQYIPSEKKLKLYTKLPEFQAIFIHYKFSYQLIS